MTCGTPPCIEQSTAIFGLRGNQASMRSARSGFRREQIFPGLSLTTFKVDPGGGLAIDFVKPENIFEFGFVLSGSARTTTLESSRMKNFELGPNAAIAHYMPNMPARFEIRGEGTAHMMGIEMELPLMCSMLGTDTGLDKALARVFAGSALPFHRSCGMCALQRVAAGQILACSFSGPARSLFIRAKVLELLAYQLEALCDGRKRPEIVLSPEDEERIRRARGILREKMASPPGLAALASAVGVNSNKLKMGFKSVFGKTAFGCLHEDRMHRAQELLQERRFNVSQVAWEVGYTNVGHFSVAFRKFFGVKPKDFRADFSGRFGSGC